MGRCCDNQFLGLIGFYPQKCVCVSLADGVVWRITQTTPHDISGTLGFLLPKTYAKFDRGHRPQGRQIQVGWVKLGEYRQITRLSRKRYLIDACKLFRCSYHAHISTHIRAHSQNRPRRSRDHLRSLSEWRSSHSQRFVSSYPTPGITVAYLGGRDACPCEIFWKKSLSPSNRVYLTLQRLAKGHCQCLTPFACCSFLWYSSEVL